MLGVLLKAFPLRPLNKRREKRRERETINLRTEKKKKKMEAERIASLKPLGI